jgi:hypothetical protein
LRVMTDAVRKRGGVLMGDLTKDGRPATAEEIRHLHGTNDDGSPRGLVRCTECGDYRGICLDPGEQFSGHLMKVHCRCENHNRCARCGARLRERRLNANYCDRRERSVWHMPAFVGLRHKCARGTKHQV